MFPLSFCVAFQVYNQKNPIVSGVSVSFFDFGFIKKRREKKRKGQETRKGQFWINCPGFAELIWRFFDREGQIISSFNWLWLIKTFTILISVE